MLLFLLLFAVSLGISFHGRYYYDGKRWCSVLKRYPRYCNFLAWRYFAISGLLYVLLFSQTVYYSSLLFKIKFDILSAIFLVS